MVELNSRWCMVIVFISMMTTSGFCQHSSEKELFSFKTTNGKKLSLSLDTISNTMIYRYGKRGKTELEVMDNLNDADTVFTYRYYFRGGGAQNAGLDLNHICFKRANYVYVVYYEYSAEIEKSDIGIRVKNLETGTTTTIKGLMNSMKGSLVDFRFNEWIPLVLESNL